MNLGKALLGAVAVVLAFAPVSARERAWTSPQALSSGLPSGTPTLAFDARGWAFATWADRSGGRRSASRAPSASSFGPQRTAPDTGEEVLEGPPPAPVVDAKGGVIAVQERRLRNACGVAIKFGLTPRFGNVNGTFAPAQGAWTIYSHTLPPAVTLAGNARGLAVAAWLELHRNAQGHCVRPVSADVRVAVRRPGMSFGPPVTLAHRVSTQSIASAVDAHGDIVVVWRTGNAIVVRVRSPGGAWGRVRRVPAAQVASLAVSAAADGTIYLLWTGRPAHTSYETRDVSAAVLPAASARIATTTLDHGIWPNDLFDLSAHFEVRLGLLRHGAIAAWTSWDGAHMRVQTATTGQLGFRSASQATPTGQDWMLGDLAVGPTGQPALALISGAVGLPAGPFVALRSAAGAFSAPEAIGTGTARVTGEALAFDPRTRRPTLVWIEVQPGAQYTATAQAATRSPAP
jgi:hypothetical protein